MLIPKGSGIPLFSKNPTQAPSLLVKEIIIIKI